MNTIGIYILLALIAAASGFVIFIIVRSWRKLRRLEAEAARREEERRRFEADRERLDRETKAAAEEKKAGISAVSGRAKFNAINAALGGGK